MNVFNISILSTIETVECCACPENEKPNAIKSAALHGTASVFVIYATTITSIWHTSKSSEETLLVRFFSLSVSATFTVVVCVKAIISR